ncbi:Rrf2 family transcriptional regulator [Clostridium sp. BNL1100]|uniref:RrF2 family transcriptional regulator n=1 Tax=Clostridium sp. BNL1100 TaxID=755731 RepID=UPI00024A7500|nr:Rrf2 family transcriptional regulator [Clostridium sp. BNL1100]AEY66449.1 rrf2 family protein, putative transcriptional regulator [Clostridium sp. BNL1100]
MKVSTKGRYGLRAIVDLAAHESEGQVSLKSVAERQRLSENYLEQLFSSLKKSGLVKSIRGAQGGYLLARPADKITVGDILRSLEGTLCPVECIDPDVPASCDRADECVTADVWAKIRDKINEVVDSITLADLVSELGNKTNNDYIYYI